MITVFNVWTKIIYFVNIHKICDNGLIFTWISTQTNVQTDRLTKHTLTCHLETQLTVVSA